MSFFDDKQEILKIELTTYGRFLISRGKFKPAYYAFFDDDVIYDAEYANLSESQNSIQTRILDETPSLKPQTTFTSVENNVKLNTLLYRELEKLKLEESQISSDKNYALSLPLGKSSHNSDYAPAWALNIISGTISSSAKQIDNTNNSYDATKLFINYPQIEMNDFVYDIKKKVNDDTRGDGYFSLSAFTVEKPDGGFDTIRYEMRDQTMVLDLKELNVEELVKNFDIEIFLEEEEQIPGKNETKTSLRQLSFIKEPIEILNGILLDEKIFFDDGTLEVDDSFVEYFFEVTADDEIELPALPAPQTATYANTKNPPPFGENC